MKMIDDVFVGDCVDVLKRFDDCFIDLTVTSPPYDKLRKYNGFIFDFESIAKELYRVTKIGGVVVWVVNDETIKGSETGTSFRQAIYFMGLGFFIHDTMIYQKTGCSMPSRNRYLSNFEYMFVFSKGKPKTYNLIKDRKNRFPKRWGGGRKVRNRDGTWSYRENYVAKEYGVRFNIWKYNNGGQGYGHSDKFAHEHPATFPENLAKDHIVSWSNEGDIVLDPMCGSGTTLKMAKELNRHFIGIDISQEYVEITKKRLGIVDCK